MLITIFSFIVAIALLIAIHEGGHFFTARWFNVKVLKFSIGFGPELFRFVGKKDATEYVISAIPLGGYVKMLDENEAEVADCEKARAFNQQSVYKRFAIVFAGPFVNLIFAVFAFSLMYIIGIQAFKPQIAAPQQDSIAWQVGLQQGDRITAINQHAVISWSEFQQQMVNYFVDRQDIELSIIDAHQRVMQKHLPLSQVDDSIDVKDMNQHLGLELDLPKIKPIIGKVYEDTPAYQADLRIDDEIIAIDNVEITSWLQMVNYVQLRPNTRMQLKIIRSGNQQIISLQSGEKERNGEKVGILGVSPKSDSEAFERLQLIVQYDMMTSLSKGIENTWSISWLTLKVLGKMLVGKASLENLSGPITIAQVAGHSMRQGVEYFLRFLAIVSLSLGIINLLPIPVLDGGHLFFYSIEILRGKPLAAKTQDVLLRIGVVILVMLMTIALYNDIQRL